MDTDAIRDLLTEIQSPLVAAVVDGIRSHVAKLESRKIGFYGYALLPGEPYDIHSIVVATNEERNIKASSSDDMYRYYRFSVDEWAHWDYDEFVAANALLVEANERFASLHTRINDSFTMDEIEIAFSNTLLEALVGGLKVAKEAGIFGVTEPFLVIWISDSSEPIILESVKQLNSADVTKEFLNEFA